MLEKIWAIVMFLKLNKTGFWTALHSLCNGSTTKQPLPVGLREGRSQAQNSLVRARAPTKRVGGVEGNTW